ncbi:MAG: CBS domain-containing protein [Pseudomonadota bacterium]|nr:CBS domain-containing protein [Pseudomonadota bacterium]
MKTVREVLEKKGGDVWTIDPGVTVREALTQMAEKDVGALVVTKEGSVIGVISERDYARKVIMKGKSSLETLVEDIMVRDPRCVTPAETIGECMATMTEKRIRHLPVLEGISLVGLVSIGDVVKSIISAHESKIDELESYIYGK